jgi:hypothetical protein
MRVWWRMAVLTSSHCFFPACCCCCRAAASFNASFNAWGSLIFHSQEQQPLSRLVTSEFSAEQEIVVQTWFLQTMYAGLPADMPSAHNSTFMWSMQ